MESSTPRPAQQHPAAVSPAPNRRTMKAMVCHSYGAPDVVTMEDVSMPVIGDGDLLVRIRSALMTPSDVVARAGTPYFARLFFGLRRPKWSILGSDFAGDVVAVGAGVTHFRVGDTVVGGDQTFGAHAEYIQVDELGAVAPMPANLGYEESVALFDGSMTALPFLRAAAQLFDAARASSSTVLPVLSAWQRSRSPGISERG